MNVAQRVDLCFVRCGHDFYCVLALFRHLERLSGGKTDEIESRRMALAEDDLALGWSLFNANASGSLVHGQERGNDSYSVRRSFELMAHPTIVSLKL